MNNTADVKTRILFLLDMDLSKAEVIEIMTSAAEYRQVGIISAFDHTVIFRRCKDCLADTVTPGQHNKSI